MHGIVINNMKQQVVYIHGGDSFSDHADFLSHLQNAELRDPMGEGSIRWTKTLREDLGDNFELFSPQMPNWQNAKYEEWKIWFEKHFEYLHDDLILIGWSLGGMFLLKYLSEDTLPCSVRKLLIVASPAGDYKIEAEPGNDCKSFQFSCDDLINIQEKISSITIYHSKDDFVVPYDHALKLKEALPDAELVTFTDRNHFLQEEFPELIEKIKEVSGE